jgi:hypothetical protein
VSLPSHSAAASCMNTVLAAVASVSSEISTTAAARAASRPSRLRALCLRNRLSVSAEEFGEDARCAAEILRTASAHLMMSDYIFTHAPHQISDIAKWFHHVVASENANTQSAAARCHNACAAIH